MASLASLLIAIALNVACIYVARLMAVHKGRSTRTWMWWAALLGPLPLPVLALLPHAARAPAA